MNRIKTDIYIKLNKHIYPVFFCKNYNFNPILYQCVFRASFLTCISSCTVQVVLRDAEDADGDPLLCDILIRIVAVLMRILNEQRNSSSWEANKTLAGLVCCMTEFEDVTGKLASGAGFFHSVLSKTISRKPLQWDDLNC